MFSGKSPEQWTQTIVVPLHKKGSATSPNTDRGIALIDVLSKVYITILTKRLTFFVDDYDKICPSLGSVLVTQPLIMLLFCTL